MILPHATKHPKRSLPSGSPSKIFIHFSSVPCGINALPFHNPDFITPVINKKG
jgi:hypothetical protein